MDNSIGVMLTSFKRPHTLRQQLAAIDAQTVKPKDVVIWHNDGGVQPDVEAMRGRKVVALNYNSGVWARFSAALWLLPYDYIVVLDDDTIPGPRWLEHCLGISKDTFCLLGVNGVLFPSGERSPRKYVELAAMRDKNVLADIVGHSWFMPRDLLRFACGSPRFEGAGTAGEDYHLAFCSQAYGSMTMVPLSPNMDFWGSVNATLGTDANALYRQPGEEEKKKAAHDYYRQQGWKTLVEMMSA